MRWLPLVLALLFACGDDAAVTDAGGGDSGRDAAVPRDAGPVCAEACGVGHKCCDTPAGPACIHIAADPSNCGNCGVDCVATERGTTCEGGNCVCGDFVSGCAGSSSVCCPPLPGQTKPYCADLAQASQDCGSCGFACDPARADRCDGSRCLCGEGSRRQCDGTPTDTCCADSVGMFGCVDTTNGRLHCGACGNICSPGQSCVDGACVE